MRPTVQPPVPSARSSSHVSCPCPNGLVECSFGTLTGKNRTVHLFWFGLRRLQGSPQALGGPSKLRPATASGIAAQSRLRSFYGGVVTTCRLCIRIIRRRTPIH